MAFLVWYTDVIFEAPLCSCHKIPSPRHGEQGLGFLNFRPSEPYIVRFEQRDKDMVAQPPANERQVWQQLFDPVT